MTLSGVNASQSSSLFAFHSTSPSAGLLSFQGLSISDSVLSENLFSVSGPSLSFLVDGLAVSGLSYNETNPTPLKGLFLLSSLNSFLIQNTYLSVSSRSEIGNSLLIADEVSSLLVQNCAFHILDESSSSPLSFIDLSLPQLSNVATFSNTRFEGMRKTIGGGGFISATGLGSIYMSGL